VARFFLSRYGRYTELAVLIALGVALSSLAAGCSQGRLPENRPVGEATPPPSGPGWENLLDAAHYTDWKTVKGADVFRIEDGVLHIPGSVRGGYAGYMREKLGDFELHIEFKVAKGSNSGVFVRSPAEDPVFRGMEIQVLGDYGYAPSTHSSGALYDVASPMFNMSRPCGEWNSYDITCQSRHIDVRMNGWKVVDVDLSALTMPVGKFPTPFAELATEGYVFLQDHHNEVWYRNIRVKKL